MTIHAEFWDTLRELVRVPSVVGCERRFFLKICRELDALGIAYRFYDGLLEAYSDEKSPYILSVHVDRHGLICTGPNEFQYAAFVAKFRGERNGDSVSEQTLKDIQNRFVGEKVYAYEPWSGSYVGMGAIESAYICPQRQNLFFSVSGLEYCQPGISVAYEDKLSIDPTLGTLSCQLDNVISVAVALELFRLGFKGKILFTALEEAGKSWGFLLDYFQRHNQTTNSLIVLDTSPFPNLEDVLKYDLVLRNQDANGAFFSPLVQKIAKTAQDLNLKTIFKDVYIQDLNKKRESNPLSLGRTELGRLVAASSGQITGSTLQIPTTGYHTAHETTNMKSLDAMLTVLENILF